MGITINFSNISFNLFFPSVINLSRLFFLYPQNWAHEYTHPIKESVPDKKSHINKRKKTPSQETENKKGEENDVIVNEIKNIKRIGKNLVTSGPLDLGDWQRKTYTKIYGNDKNNSEKDKLHYQLGDGGEKEFVKSVRLLLLYILLLCFR